MKYIAVTAAIAGLSFLAPMQSNASTVTVLLDSFDIDQAAGDLPDSDISNTSSVAFGAGQRIFTAKNVVLGKNTTPQTSIEAFDGQLGFSNVARSAGWAKITYTNVGDITFGANNFFTFNLPGADSFDRIANFTASVKDVNGHVSTYSEVLDGLFSPFLYYSSFTGSANFSAVSELSFTIDSANVPGYGPQLGLDGTLDSIEISGEVPVPAAGLLLISALGGLAAARRKKSA